MTEALTMKSLARVREWVVPELPRADPTVWLDVEESLHRQALHLNKIVTVAAAPTAALVLAILWPHTSHTGLACWLVMTLLQSALALVANIDWPRRQKSVAERTLDVRYALVIGGATWGSICVFAMPADPEWQGFLGMLVASFMTANVIFAGVVSKLFWSFQAPLVLIGGISFAVEGTSVGLAVAAFLLYAVPFASVLAAISRNSSRQAAFFAAIARRSADALTRMNERLAHEANHDPLTGLINRSAFSLLLDAELEKAPSKTAVLFMDLDGFKAVNDRYGHDLGDQALAIAAGRLTGQFRSGDRLARFGGDEFTALIHDVTDDGVLDRVTSRILGAFAEPFDIEGERLAIGVSIGVALSEPGIDAREILRRADAALYQAKDRGGCVSATFFSPADAESRPISAAGP